MVVCRFAVRIKPDYVFEVTELCILYLSSATCFVFRIGYHHNKRFASNSYLVYGIYMERG